MQIWLQKIVPQHGLSRLVGFITKWRLGPIVHWAINLFVKKYQVNTDDVENFSANNYCCFNAFFTRALKEGARPINQQENSLVSPVDATVSAFGNIDNQQIFQAKGHSYSLSDLLAAQTDLVAKFAEGSFITAYLSPKDYHRVHMPCAGSLQGMCYVPGDLFSVNEAAVAEVPNLFARNERMVALFDTEFGPMAYIMVGAMLVGSINTVWHGDVTPPYGKQVKHWQYDEPRRFAKGEQLGHFNMGSTVILLLPKQLRWQDNVEVGASLRMGELLATVPVKADDVTDSIDT